MLFVVSLPPRTYRRVTVQQHYLPGHDHSCDNTHLGKKVAYHNVGNVELLHCYTVDTLRTYKNPPKISDDIFWRVSHIAACPVYVHSIFGYTSSNFLGASRLLN